MKVVLDTNVMVSGIFFSGPPYHILDGWRKKFWDLMISPDIYQEYETVVRNLQKHHSDVNVDHFLDLILINSEMCYPDKLSHSVTQDPKDEMFLMCALSSQAKIIVSGDKHLLNVSGYQGIEILKPKQFVDKYAPTENGIAGSE